MPRIRNLALAAFLAGGTASAQTPTSADIVKRLRPAVRLENRPDTAFNILDRMRYYHVPGVSLAVVDPHSRVYAGGFGVTEFGGKEKVTLRRLLTHSAGLTPRWLPWDFGRRRPILRAGRSPSRNSARYLRTATDTGGWEWA